MSLNLTDLTAAMRIRLNDPSGTHLWVDAALAQAIAEAVAEHSLMYPHLTYVRYDVSNGQTAIGIVSQAPGQPDLNPAAPAGLVDMIGVVGVELPPLTHLPMDPWSSNPYSVPLQPAVPWSTMPTMPAQLALRGTQGYRYRWGAIRLRNPASGPEVGTGTLLVAQLQTWTLPDSSHDWDGPISDLPLLYLFAERRALQMLADWQASNQGLAGETLLTGTIAGAQYSSQYNVSYTIDTSARAAALEVEIAREVALRAARNATTPPLPVGQ